MAITIYSGHNLCCCSFAVKERMSTSLEKQPCQKLQNRVSGSGRLKSMIMSWLINSMNNDIGENFLLFGIAKDIWDAAKETYSSSENTSELFQVESALHDFRQGEQSVLSITTHSQGIDSNLTYSRLTHGNVRMMQQHTGKLWNKRDCSSFS